ncbi:MAG: monofunctional biosynthetic peptidoglycan transglycosylase [Betaproteobacteria bacterium]|nr:MAG: monofunctional biosynthetic peptidoglycan transglycosylase [Betaproteobacteria bacterium]
MRSLLSLWKMFCYSAGTAVLGLAVYEFWFLAQILYWVEHNPATTRTMDARLEAMRPNKSKTLEQKWTDYGRISIHLKRAIIVAEDAKFVEHEGFDWEGIQRAMDKNQRRGKFVARRIFEIYLNVAEWGENVFGAEAAARHYFGVDAAGLEPEQAARLAAMLPRPRYYDRNRSSPYLTSYSESILTQMSAAQVP